MEDITPKDKRIIRMACLKAAATICQLKGYGNNKSKVRHVEHITKQFEQFVYDVNSEAENKV